MASKCVLIISVMVLIMLFNFSNALDQIERELVERLECLKQLEKVFEKKTLSTSEPSKNAAIYAVINLNRTMFDEGGVYHNQYKMAEEYYNLFDDFLIPGMTKKPIKICQKYPPVCLNDIILDQFNPEDLQFNVKHAFYDLTQKTLDSVYSQEYLVHISNSDIVDIGMKSPDDYCTYVPAQ